MINRDKKVPCWKFLRDGVFNRRIILQQHQTSPSHGEQFKQLDTEHQNLDIQLANTQAFLKLQMRSHDVKYDLINNLHEHYQHMAGQALAINLWTSHLIAEEGSYPNVMPEIFKVSQESNTILRLMMAGFPMKHQEKPVDVLQSVNEVKEIFQPTLMQCNIVVVIEGHLEFQPSLDDTILKVILYNIFYIISKRLRNSGNLAIELKEQNNYANLIFHDDGCDLEETKNPYVQNKDILFMGAKKLQDFVTYMGWEIHFDYSKKGANVISLEIFPKSNHQDLPRNVVPLFDRSNRYGGN